MWSIRVLERTNQVCVKESEGIVLGCESGVFRRAHAEIDEILLSEW